MSHSPAIVTAVLVGILATGCGKKETGPRFGQSFNTIQGVSGSSYILDGYSSFVESKSGAFAPWAVLIVGVKEGVNLGGQPFDYGSIIVIEGTTAAPTFRLATPDDMIVLTSEVTVFGTKRGKGRFAVPPGGRIVPQGESVSAGRPAEPIGDASPIIISWQTRQEATVEPAQIPEILYSKKPGCEISRVGALITFAGVGNRLQCTPPRIQLSNRTGTVEGVDLTLVVNLAKQVYDLKKQDTLRVALYEPMTNKTREAEMRVSNWIELHVEF